MVSHRSQLEHVGPQFAVSVPTNYISFGSPRNMATCSMYLRDSASAAPGAICTCVFLNHKPFSPDWCHGLILVAPAFERPRPVGLPATKDNFPFSALIVLSFWLRQWLNTPPQSALSEIPPGRSYQVILRLRRPTSLHSFLATKMRLIGTVTNQAPFPMPFLTHYSPPTALHVASV